MGQTLRCITDAHIVNNIHPVARREFLFAFSKNPAQLNKSEYDSFFLQRAKIIEDDRTPGTWKVSTLSYEYNIERHRDHQEVLAFHWEDHDAANPLPHIHMGFAADDKSTLLGPKNHIPSGRVLVEDIVSFLINEMAVRPTKHKKLTWQSVVAASRKAVSNFKTW